MKKFDIIVSKLKGKINFTIILDDYDNRIGSNGFALLRPNDYKNTLILFANLFTEDFKIQHNSLATGSIMETINEEDIKIIDIYYMKINNYLKKMIFYYLNKFNEFIYIY